MLEWLRGVLERTPSGVHLLGFLDGSGNLPAPVVDLSSSRAMLMDRGCDARQALLAALKTFPWINLRGKSAIVIGYSTAGRASAAALKALGALVSVAEIDAILALKACLEGFEVRSFPTQLRNCQAGNKVSHPRRVLSLQYVVQWFCLIPLLFICSAGRGGTGVCHSFLGPCLYLQYVRLGKDVRALDWLRMTR